MTTFAAWSLAALAAWLAPLPLAGYVLLHAGLLWLIRSLYFATHPLGALAELGVTVLGTAVAAWAASRTGSAWLAFWCFFFAQALHAVPPAAPPPEAAGAADHDRAFARARRAADAALRRMSAVR